MSKAKTAIITGARGFIGGVLTDMLHDRGFTVIAVPRELLLEAELLSKFVTYHAPMHIFHLAAYGNHHDQQDDRQTILVNIAGTVSVLRATLGTPYQAFVNVSTSAVALPHTTFYSATKASGEQLARAFATKYQKPIISIRPHSVYGVGEAPHRLTSIAVKAALGGQVIPLDPKPVHDWIYVTDFVEGMLTVIDKAPLSGQAIELGTGWATSNEDVIKTVERVTKRKIKTEVSPRLRAYDDLLWVADTKEQAKLGFKPKISLAEGLTELYEHYKH